MAFEPKAVNVRDLRNHLASYLHQVQLGTEFVVMSRDRVMARLVPPGPSGPRRIGLLAGRIRIAPDFDQTSADLIAAMEGDEEAGS